MEKRYFPNVNHFKLFFIFLIISLFINNANIRNKISIIIKKNNRNNKFLLLLIIIKQ